MQKFAQNLVSFIFISLLISCEGGWNVVQNPYKLLSIMKKVVKGEKVEHLSTYFEGAKIQCLYNSQEGVDFLREKLKDSVDYLTVSEELYEGEPEYQFYINDSRTNNALFDVTVKCYYNVVVFGRESSYCVFSDIKNLTDNEEYPYIPVCLDLGIAPSKY